jgi:hypothetical protein
VGRPNKWVLKIDPYRLYRLSTKFGSRSKPIVSPIKGKPKLPGGKGSDRLTWVVVIAVVPHLTQNRLIFQLAMIFSALHFWNTGHAKQK